MNILTRRGEKPERPWSSSSDRGRVTKRQSGGERAHAAGAAVTSLDADGCSNTGGILLAPEFSYANRGLVTVCGADLLHLKTFFFLFFFFVHDSFS